MSERIFTELLSFIHTTLDWGGRERHVYLHQECILPGDYFSQYFQGLINSVL